MKSAADTLSDISSDSESDAEVENIDLARFLGLSKSPVVTQALEIPEDLLCGLTLLIRVTFFLLDCTRNCSRQGCHHKVQRKIEQCQ